MGKTTSRAAADTTPPETTDPTAGDPTDGPSADTTKGQTFQEAAAEATPDAGPGYLGTSPEAVRTGLDEGYGLSQRNPAILQGEPVPDPRPDVDDSEAIEAAKAAESADQEG